MKSYLDCIPCFIRQTLDSVRKVTDEESVQEEVLRYVLWVSSRMDLNESPPFIGQLIHRMIRNKTKIVDPYMEVKKQFNRELLSRYSVLKYLVDHSNDPLETAVRLSIAGNVIDLGIHSQIATSDIQNAIDHALCDPLYWDKSEFIEAVNRARSILYLADNAGEIVLDRLLIEQLPVEKITLVVRGFPILNDVTLDDAREVGLSNIVNVMDNGSDAPGTILSDCCDDFIHRFEQADMVISKGQGNYETLSEVEKEVFFILKVKCAVIARHIGCQVGDMICQNAKRMSTLSM